MEPSAQGEPSTSPSVDDSQSVNRAEDSELFPSVPALNQAASNLAQIASYFTQCLPVPGYTGIPNEGQELAILPPVSTSGRPALQTSSAELDGSSLSPCVINSSGSASQETSEISGQMAPFRVFQNGASLFQGLVDRARKTVRGSADDIGWLHRTQSLPATEDGTTRFLEILDSVRKNEHKLPDTVVYLLVPGLFSNHGPLYFVKTKAYFSKMGLVCHIAKIHSESSVSKNAREIKEYIEEIYWGSRKRVLLLGHSKGGVDAAAALSLYWPQLKDKVAGLHAHSCWWRYGEKSDGLVTRKDAEVPGSVAVRPERKLDHAWMVYSSMKEEPGDQADTSWYLTLLTLLVEVAQKRRHEKAMKDE
ncbi:hypothetical protein ZWY2020_052445 [Hordeum vulgare]|nr:hypothetical protein ZWY2020_052445 [Hordeum vulgare]